MFGSTVLCGFTPHFTATHPSTIELFRRGAAILGTKCKVRELDDADNARGLGKNAMIVDCLMSFSNLVRALARVQKEKGGVPTPWFR